MSFDFRSWMELKERQTADLGNSPCHFQEGFGLALNVTEELLNQKEWDHRKDQLELLAQFFQIGQKGDHADYLAELYSRVSRFRVGRLVSSFLGNQPQMGAYTRMFSFRRLKSWAALGWSVTAFRLTNQMSRTYVNVTPPSNCGNCRCILFSLSLVG